MKHGSETKPFFLANSLVMCHRLVTYHKLYNSQHKVSPPAGPSCTSPPQTVHTCTSASLQRAGADRAGLCSHWAPSVAVKYSLSVWCPLKRGQHVAPQMLNPAWTRQRGRESHESPAGDAIFRRRHHPDIRWCHGWCRTSPLLQASDTYWRCFGIFHLCNTPLRYVVLAGFIWA